MFRDYTFQYSVYFIVYSVVMSCLIDVHYTCVTVNTISIYYFNFLQNG